MQICTSLQAENHASTPALSFFTGRMPFLLPINSIKALKAKATNSTTTSIPTTHTVKQHDESRQWQVPK